MVNALVGRITLNEKAGAVGGGGVGDSKSIDRLQKSIEKLIQSNLSLINSLGGGGRGGKNKEGSGAPSGAAIGAVAGAVMGGISMLVDVLMSFAPIVGIMKLLKGIIGILFLPLVPILKPVLIILGAYAKAIIPIAQAQAKLIQSVIVLLIDIGKVIWSLFKVLGYAFTGQFDKASIEFSNTLALLETVWDDFVTIGEDTSNLISTVWSSVQTFGKDVAKAFDDLTKAAVKDAKLASDAQVRASAAARSAEKKYGRADRNTSTRDGDVYTPPPTNNNSGLNYTPNLNYTPAPPGLGAIGQNRDGSYIYPSAAPSAISSNANDYSSAKKSGVVDTVMKTVNLVVNNPVMSKESDIKNLVKQIQSELAKENRRYSSY